MSFFLWGPKTPHPRHLRFSMLLMPLGFGLFSCDAGFEAVSVYPSIVDDDASEWVMIYGHGFEEGATASVVWIGDDNQTYKASLNDLEFIDPYTLKGRLPPLSGVVPYPIYPYKEFTSYTGDVSPGLYDCLSGEPVIWDGFTLQGYCDEQGTELIFASPGQEVPRIPPGRDDASVFNYATWYQRVRSCSRYFDPASTVLSLDEQDELFNRLVPDYGLGCFYPSDPSVAPGDVPNRYSYCPLKIPAVEVDIEVTNPDGERSRMSRGLTLLDPDLDYYGNPAYGDRVAGSYALAVELPTGLEPRLLALADVNGDQWVDLFVADPSDQTLSLLAGPDFSTDGHETIGTPVLELGFSPSSIVVGDLNGDGIVDLVLASSEGPEVFLYHGVLDDSGVYALDDGIAVSMGLDDEDFSLSGIVLADVDDLNGQDLIATSRDRGMVLVRTQRDDGSFAEVVDYNVGGAPLGAVLGLLDDDNRLDIVVADAETNAFRVLMNNGDGTFGLHESSPLALTPTAIAVATRFNQKSGPGRLRLQDLNGDDVADLIVVGEGEEGPAMQFLIGNGNGGFADASPETVSLSHAPVDARLAMVDHDDEWDLLILADDGYLSFLKGDGHGTLSPDRDVDLFLLYRGYGLDYGTAALAAAELDGALGDDIVVGALGLSEAVLFANPSTINDYYRYSLNYCAI